MSRVVLSLLVLTTLVWLAGCDILFGGGSGRSNVAMDGDDPGTDPGPDPEADPDDYVPLTFADCTSFVSHDSGDDANGGATETDAKATIRGALAIAAVSEVICLQNRADAGTYSETGTTLAVTNGLTLLGGFASDWSLSDGSTPTAIDTASVGFDIATRGTSVTFIGVEIRSADSSSRQPAIGVRVGGDTSDFRLFSSVIRSGDVDPSPSLSPQSSYGVLAHGVARITISESVITSGDGGSGIAGTSGDPGVDATNDAVDGSPVTMCNTNGPGGSGGSGGTHPTIASLNGYNGGAGGSVGRTSLDDGEDGEGSGTVPGGAGGTHGPTPADGEDGANGADGIDGDHGVFSGDGLSTAASSYVPTTAAPGGSGSDGSPGTGGGGGGAYGCSFCMDGPGSGGGGGGAAGSAGSTAEGGVGGGGSFGVFLTDITEIEINDSSISSADGGDGGDGGLGGAGGAAGSGGVGSDPCPTAGGAGGRGGDGGRGGNGGDGAAGSGGPSVTVFFEIAVDGTVDIADSVLVSGNGGDGGVSRHGQAGGGGDSVVIYDRNISGGAIGANTITPGVGGRGGTATGTGSDGPNGLTLAQNF